MGDEVGSDRLLGLSAAITNFSALSATDYIVSVLRPAVSAGLIDSRREEAFQRAHERGLLRGDPRVVAFVQGGEPALFTALDIRARAQALSRSTGTPLESVSAYRLAGAWIFRIHGAHFRIFHRTEISEFTRGEILRRLDGIRASSALEIDPMLYGHGGLTREQVAKLATIDARGLSGVLMRCPSLADHVAGFDAARDVVRHEVEGGWILFRLLGFDPRPISQ